MVGYDSLDDRKLPCRPSVGTLRLKETQAQRKASQFLKGPIPLTWLQKAASLPGKALAVALAIQFKRGLNGNNDAIAVTTKLVQKIVEMNRKTLYRAIADLERAGLIKVERQRGQSPRVTILDLKGNS